ncbi:hypothetical protein GN956_G17874 [Arapaima gigas]
MLNLTLTALAPSFGSFTPSDFALWFQVYLVLFLPSINASSLSVIPLNISCESYHQIVQGFKNIVSSLSMEQSLSVYQFSLHFLMGQSTEGFPCGYANESSRDWFVKNFGPFGVYGSYEVFLNLNKNFSGVDAVDLLTQTQLAHLAATPGQLKTPEDVRKIMAVINSYSLASFFDIVSPVIQANEDTYSYEVKSALLQEVLDKGDLSAPPFLQSQVLIWLTNRLTPLLSGLTASQVPLIFNIVLNRSCNTVQELVDALSSVQSSLDNETQNEIYSNILRSLKEPTAVRCYVNGSFFLFLKKSFLDFGFPNLTTFLSLMPNDRQPELISSILPAELGIYFSQPGFTDDTKNLCTLLSQYSMIQSFMETVDVPESLRMSILDCVWPLALSSDNETDVNTWFQKSLRNYLKFLTKDLISFSEIHNASCLAFRNLVSILGENNIYNNTDFTKKDVFNSIRSYLSTGPKPKCYSATDPQLNSTAWFLNYIGMFVNFITPSDIKLFVPTGQLQLFLENHENIQLFNNTAIPQDVISFYTSQLYLYNPNFNPLQLPGQFLCSVPDSAYTHLSQTQSISILTELSHFCNGTSNSVVIANLVENIQVLDSTTIQTLGQSAASLTVGQITSISVNVLVSSLPTISGVTNWNLGQTLAIVQSLIAGGFQTNSTSALLSLGSLITGVPSAIINSISSYELLVASQNQKFITNIMNAPAIVQQTFVSKIISLNPDPVTVIQNVPNVLAFEIPRVLLTFSENSVLVARINNKTWSQQQVFQQFTLYLCQHRLSASVLQGFTCSGVQNLNVLKIRSLIRAFRPRQNHPKVQLVETQLTCMYNYIKDEAPQDFTNYPSDMLLYYKYENVKAVNCKSYFRATGAANFGVLSKVLNKEATLLKNAVGCLGISRTNLTSEQVAILGNMVCTLNSSFIENSDPLILEMLKNCSGFTAEQVTAMENLLFTGTTMYGSVSTWNLQTLQDLGILPLYLTARFWNKFTHLVKQQFLRVFIPLLKKQATALDKLRSLFQQCSSTRSKRAAGCTAGNITQATIADGAFPFSYSLSQFDLCLDVNFVKDNQEDLVSKVVDADLQGVILSKLNEQFPSGLTDERVQQLGSVSRVATLDNISKWNITKIDTLCSLMVSSDGLWEAAKSQLIIMKYLSSTGSTLGSAELNCIGGVNLCSLNISVISTITSGSIGNANPLDLSNCSTEQKSELYQKANESFSTFRGQARLYYQFIGPYLSGAPLSDIQRISAENISMDIATLSRLNIQVLMNLTVKEMAGLLGSNLADLKTFENKPAIHMWISAQPQTSLDTLRLGLTGGTTSSSPSAGGTANAANSSPATSPSASTQVSGAPLQSSSSNTTSSSSSLSSSSSSSTTGGARGIHSESPSRPAALFLPVVAAALLKLC